MLIGSDPAALERTLADAEERLAAHDRLERQRIAEGLETDFERYLRGGEVTD